MKGKIIHLTEIEGIILTDDGKRYKFEITEWKSQESPSNGDIVDFIEDGEKAKEVILLESKKDIKMPDLSKVNNLIDNVDMKNIKIIGGIGAVCLFFTWIPYLGFIFALAGLIMLTIAIKKISDKNTSENTFKNWIIALVISLVSLVLNLFIGGAMLGIASSVSDEGSALAALGVGTIILLVLNYAVQVVLGILYKRVFHSVAEITNEKLFRTAGTLFFWGGILYIILVGAFLFFIGWILVTVAFFTIKTDTQTIQQNG